MSRLFDLRMHDGTRHFGSLKEHYSPAYPEWEYFRDCVEALPGAQLEAFVTDHVTEAWIDFSYEGHFFQLNNQHGSWWCFVKDVACPDELLLRVLDYFEKKQAEG